MPSDEIGRVLPSSATPVPEDPPLPSPIMATSNVLIRSFSLVLFIIAILLCLKGMSLGFVTFMILGLAFEVIDLVIGMNDIRQMSSGVTRCVAGWKELRTGKSG